MVKKNTSIELAVALMLKGMAYMLCILVCAMFLPFIVSLIGVTFVKELTLDEAVYRFHSNWIYILFVLMSALEEQTKQERAQRISNSIK
jgi:hypothetical protein